MLEHFYGDWRWVPVGERVTHIEFLVPQNCDLTAVSTLLEQTFIKKGLRISLKDTLRSYSGCIHWHLKHGEDSGTLELTLWEAKRRVWASVQDGRRAAWIDEELPRLKFAIEKALHEVVPAS